MLGNRVRRQRRRSALYVARRRRVSTATPPARGARDPAAARGGTAVAPGPSMARPLVRSPHDVPACRDRRGAGAPPWRAPAVAVALVLALVSVPSARGRDALDPTVILDRVRGAPAASGVGEQPVHEKAGRDEPSPRAPFSAPDALPDAPSFPPRPLAGGAASFASVRYNPPHTHGRKERACWSTSSAISTRGSAMPCAP
jgi:hypothetical protein